MPLNKKAKKQNKTKQKQTKPISEKETRFWKLILSIDTNENVSKTCCKKKKKIKYFEISFKEIKYFEIAYKVCIYLNYTLQGQFLSRV